MKAAHAPQAQPLSFTTADGTPLSGVLYAPQAAAGASAKASVLVAAGSGYWRDWAPASRRKAPLMLHLAAPLLGWFPGKRLRMVGDLPGPAMPQWSRWCRHPEFAWGAEPEHVLPSLRATRFPIHALSFTDDDAMTANCTRKLLAALPNAPSQLQVVAQADLGLTAIGHVGAFRSEVESAVWPLIEASLIGPAP